MCGYRARLRERTSFGPKDVERRIAKRLHVIEPLVESIVERMI